MKCVDKAMNLKSVHTRELQPGHNYQCHTSSWYVKHIWQVILKAVHTRESHSMDTMNWAGHTDKTFGGIQKLYPTVQYCINLK